MKKVIFLVCGLLIGCCIFSTDVYAKFDYNAFEKTLDKYERGLSHCSNDVVPSWDRLYRKKDTSGLKECDVVNSIIDNILIRIRKLRGYIEFKPLISKRKVLKFEQMLYKDLRFTKRRLTRELEGFGGLKSMSEVIAMLKNPVLVHILSQVQEETRKLILELDRFIKQLE